MTDDVRNADTGVAQDEVVPTSEMTEKDWEDVKESEFRDITDSAMGSKVAFVFEHDEIGLHGFQFIKDTGTLKPCTFEEVDTV